MQENFHLKNQTMMKVSFFIQIQLILTMRLKNLNHGKIMFIVSENHYQEPTVSFPIFLGFRGS